MKVENGSKEWDLVIDSHSSIFNFHFKDIWHYRDLLFILVKRDFVSFYKQTILGPLWFFIQPLLTTIIYVIIFNQIAGIKVVGIPPPLFYMSGIILWNYFSECLIKTSTVFRDNANVFGKVYFPRLIMPLSIVISNLVKFGVQILLFWAVYLYYILFKNYSPGINGYMIYLPVAIILLAGLALGLGLIITALTTKYRDLVFLVAFAVQLLMYATPIIYPLSGVPEKYHWILMLNPMTGIIETIRYSLFGTGTFSMGMIGYSFLMTIIFLLTGVLVFNKVQKNFVDTV